MVQPRHSETHIQWDPELQRFDPNKKDFGPNSIIYPPPFLYKKISTLPPTIAQRGQSCCCCCYHNTHTILSMLCSLSNTKTKWTHLCGGCWALKETWKSQIPKPQIQKLSCIFLYLQWVHELQEGPELPRLPKRKERSTQLWPLCRQMETQKCLSLARAGRRDPPPALLGNLALPSSTSLLMKEGRGLSDTRPLVLLLQLKLQARLASPCRNREGRRTAVCHSEGK